MVEIRHTRHAAYQITYHFVFCPKFRRAVLVRWPHQDSWTVALVTGTPQHEVAGILGPEQIAVFVPTTPNITAGLDVLVQEVIAAMTTEPSLSSAS